MTFGIKKYTRSSGLALLAFLVLMAAELVFMHQWKQRDSARDKVLRVASPASEWMRSGISPYGPGFERELLDRFAEENGVTWVWMRTGSWEKAWQMLADGEADLVPGLGAQPPKPLKAHVKRGPAYASFKPLIVRSDKRYGLRRPDEICEMNVLTANNQALIGTLYRQTDGIEGCSPLPVIHSEYDPKPILAALQKNRARFGLVDSGRFMLWQPFYQRVRPTKKLDESLDYRWYWGMDSAHAEKLGGFWQDTLVSAWFQDTYERYFGFLPEKTDYYQLAHLARTMQRKLERYVDRIEAAAFENGIDPLLLTAVIYQESHFDPFAISRTGVRGLMQITQATAQELGINRLDPGQSIIGGSRYLKILYDRLEPYDLEEWDRWFFAMAAYNQGWGSLTDAMKLSQRLGGTGRTWREVKEVFPLLARSKYYRQAEHGYARGFEAVDYVDSIRYYYYVLQGLVILARPEAKHLPALVPPVALSGS